jgi:hypothetical protein
MRNALMLAMSLLVAGCQSTVQQGPGFANAFPSSEWGKRALGNTTAYECKVESCGGTKSVIHYASFASYGSSPELGIAGGKKLEAEFRSRASVRTTLVAMLRQTLRSEEDREVQLNMNYFTNDSYVGYVISGFSPKTGHHILGEARIDDNSVILIGVSSANTARLKPLFARLKGNLTIKVPD